MSRQCYFTGRKTAFGNTITRSGAAISTGGFGLKTTGVNRRTFKPNLHKMTILIDGKPVRTSVSVSRASARRSSQPRMFTST